MAQTFISYRRDDTGGYVGWLNHLLSQHFGQHNIFRDIDAIELGINFIQAIEREVNSCAVLLAAIGRHWLNMADKHGQRRIDHPDDLVRFEIELHFSVVSGLFQFFFRATMLNAQELPQPLAPLTHRQVFELHESSFVDDTKRLIGFIENVLKQQQPEKSGLQLLHQDMQTFVNEVLRAIPREPRRTIIDRVFLQIERNPAWLKHYKQLKTQHGIGVINSNTGRYVRTLTGFDNLGIRQAATSRLIQTYAELG